MSTAHPGGDGVDSERSSAPAMTALARPVEDFSALTTRWATLIRLFRHSAIRVLTPIIVASGLVATTSVKGQTLGRIVTREVANPWPIVVRDVNQAALGVRSTIADLHFESNNDILKETSAGDGYRLLYLRPGTHLITIKAAGYVTIQERFHLKPRQYREIEVQSYTQSVFLSFGSMRTSCPVPRRALPPKV